MNYNRVALKREAKLAMSKSHSSPYLMGLLFLVISLVSSLLVLSLNLPKGTLTELLKDSSQAFENMLNSYNYETGLFATVLTFLLNIMSLVISYGFIIFSLTVYRRQPNSMGMIFDGFQMFFRIILLEILMGIFIWLWSMLLIVPGIIAAYRYSFAPFLLIDNPHMSAMDCIRESKRLTNGYKGDLFVLDISFIPWRLLTTLPSLIPLYFVFDLSFIPRRLLMFLPLLFLVNIYVQPYYTTTLAGFYDIRIRHDDRQQNQDSVYGDRSQDYNRFGE